MTNRTWALLASAAVAIVGALTWWGWSLDPERGVRWLVLGLACPALWAFLELARVTGERHPNSAEMARAHRAIIAYGGLLLVVSLGPRLAMEANPAWVEWEAAASRASGLVLGLGLVIGGNLLPKLASPWPLSEEPFDWQRVHRFVGVVAFIAGLAILAYWLTLSPERAEALTQGTMGVAMALALGRKAVSLVTHRPPAARPPRGAGS